jgi:2-keto-3-deoxy-L-fuconate dehydrogenase
MTPNRHQPHASISGLRVLITGGASGIGQATANLFRQQGANVVVLDRAERSTAILQDLHPAIFYVRADIASDEDVKRAVSEATIQLAGLDVLVNNAGTGAQGGVEDNSDEEWLHVLDVNVLGMVRVTRAALPALRRSPCAAIINTSSIAARVGLPNRVLYSASKGAVYSFTLAIAADLIGEGIRVNSVSPGTVDTPWVTRLLRTAADPRSERAALEARQPHGRLVTAEEVAHAIYYLAAPTSGSTTGTSLAVDGGMIGVRPRPSQRGPDG